MRIFFVRSDGVAVSVSHSHSEVPGSNPGPGILVKIIHDETVRFLTYLICLITNWNLWQLLRGPYCTLTTLSTLIPSRTKKDICIQTRILHPLVVLRGSQNVHILRKYRHFYEKKLKNLPKIQNFKL